MPLRVVNERIEQAARLLTSCADLLHKWQPANFGDELQRRNIELLAQGLLNWASDFVDDLKSNRLRLTKEHCPHCGWFRPPRSVPRCPRCNLPREVHREAPERDPRRSRSA